MANGSADSTARLENWFWTQSPPLFSGKIFDVRNPIMGPVKSGDISRPHNGKATSVRASRKHCGAAGRITCGARGV